MNARQKQFIVEYLVDLNASQAAIRAGYSKRTSRAIGAELLRNPKILAAITKANEARLARTEVSADYVLSNLTEVVERCMQRAPVMVRRGKEMVQLEDEEGRDVWQFDSRGAIGGLSLLGKHLALFTEKHEVTLPQGAGVLAVPVAPDAAQWAAGAAAQQAALVARPSTLPPVDP